MDRIIEELLAVKSEQQDSVVLDLYKGIRKEVRQYIERWFEQRLEEELQEWLGRAPYERRRQCGGHRLSVACQKCGSRYRRGFFRNGRRRRRLLSMYGMVEIWLPRVKCQCGGSVSIPFRVLKRGQRVWDDLRVQVQEWADKALSLRQMWQDMSKKLGTSLGLRTLNQWVHAIHPLATTSRPFTTVPPVVVLDAIWVTRLVQDKRTRVDSLGRVRPVKKKKRGAVLIALGIWPQSGRYHVLDWELAEGESGSDWDRFLSRLIERQLWQCRGLRLMVHDGGSGLQAALRRWYAEVPSQRCVFHKLRNVWQAIIVPEDSTSSQRRALKQEIIREAAAVFRASDERQAKQLMADFKVRWSDTQGEAVATLLRDQEDTLRFYSFLERNRTWQAKTLRTTSMLERVNRFLRKFFRAANAYHSTAGLKAAVHRVLTPMAIV
jgi:hypothetical protein